MRTVKIGIDFGTSYCFTGFLHGDTVMPLVPNHERWGIPSVFYYDGKRRLAGSMADRQAERKPDCAVYSIKRQLSVSSIPLADKTFTPREIVVDILSEVVAGAESQLKIAYLQDYDELEAVITVPVSFSEPLKNFIKDAAGRVTLKNGKNLRVIGLLPEPVAASIEYFGIKKERNANILVYDLGGGTFDASLVRAKEREADIPYEVIDQEGDPKLGGDDWDRVLADWIEDKYRREKGGNVTGQMKIRFLREARKIKEDLTAQDEVITSVPVKGEDLDLEISRTEFDEMTGSLLNRSLEKIRTLLARQSGVRIDHVILTGGSSYMPQVKRGLEQSGLFSKETDILLVNPEHAIAHGAARYAVTLEWNAVRGSAAGGNIILKAPHSYGIVYHIPKENKEMVSILIRKGEELPVSRETVSETRYDDQKEALFRVMESDYIGNEKDLVEVSQGREVVQAVLRRDGEHVEKGRKSRETLTLTKDGLLTVKSVDLKNGKEVENSVEMNRFMEEN